MILVIDNYDSFTYNLVHLIGAHEPDIEVRRNDALTVSDIKLMNPSLIVLSPGPGVPADAGICPEIIETLHDSVPIFGVCLGHQCIAEAFGGKVVRAENLMHGKTSRIYHSGDGLFRGLPNPFSATRYHSLIAEEASMPDCLEITAHTSEGEIMALRHKEYPVMGVQFHPESILSEHGLRIAANLLDSVKAGTAR